MTPIDRQIDKYRLLALIANGGMGHIYLAMARGPSGFKKLVVLKCLRETSEDDDPMRKMFLDEGLLAARLNHPHVVQTYEAGEWGRLHYIAMEYLDGQPLSRIRRVIQPIDPRFAARIVSDALSGLHYAHELRDFDGTPLGIVHRDLSPPNIVITYDGVVKIVDFGIAKTVLASRATTDVGILKGKISYMAPEQACRDDADRRADIFAMGIIFWELLTDRRLVEAQSAGAALSFLLNGTFPSVSSVRSDVDPELDRIVARSLEKEAGARYPTALAMRAELEEYLARRNSTVSQDDLGRLVSERFASRREQMRVQIQDCIAAAADEADAPTHVIAAPRASRVPTTDSSANAVLRSDLAEHPSISAGAGTVGSVTSNATQAAVPRALHSRATSRAAGALVFVLACCWGAYSASRSSGPAAVTASASGKAAASRAASWAIAIPPSAERPEEASGEDTAPNVSAEPSEPSSKPAAQREARTRASPRVPTRAKSSPRPASAAPTALPEAVESAASIPTTKGEVRTRARLVEERPQVELVE